MVLTLLPSVPLAINPVYRNYQTDWSNDVALRLEESQIPQDLKKYFKEVVGGAKIQHPT